MRFDRWALLVAAILTAAGAAAALEDAGSRYKIGLMDERGRHVAQNYGEARRRFLKAAASGDGLAEFSLGVFSARGLAAPKDYVEAERWFRKAAEHGVAAAQFNLGVLYAHGLGVSQDYVLAHLWFSLAAAQGEEGAKAALDEAAAQMAPSEIAEAERLANDWTPSTWELRL
jgi:TPR repeat protein